MESEDQSRERWEVRLLAALFAFTCLLTAAAELASSATWLGLDSVLETTKQLGSMSSTFLLGALGRALGLGGGSVKL